MYRTNMNQNEHNVYTDKMRYGVRKGDMASVLQRDMARESERDGERRLGGVSQL